MSEVVKVEFCGGGPADGGLRSFEHPGEYIRIFAPQDPKLKWTSRPEEVGASSGDHVIPIVVHLYRNAKRVSRSGNRLYAYAGKEKR